MIVFLIIICFVAALIFGGAMMSVNQYDNESNIDSIIMYLLLISGMFGCYGLMFYLIKIY